METETVQISTFKIRIQRFSLHKLVYMWSVITSSHTDEDNFWYTDYIKYMYIFI